jgi:aconitase B
LSLLVKKGYCPNFGAARSRTVMPCCSLCMGVLNKDCVAIYKHLNFNQIEQYVENAKGVTP